MKRDGAPATPNDVFRGVGRVIAIARTGPTGGVTFPNVPPGTYLVIFQVVEWVTHLPGDPLMGAALAVAVIAGIAGSASGGQGIALPLTEKVRPSCSSLTL